MRRVHASILIVLVCVGLFAIWTPGALGAASGLDEPVKPVPVLVDVWGEGGPGEDAGLFRTPRGIAVDWNTGDVCVAESGNSRLQWFTASGENLDVWGSGPGSAADEFKWPQSVAIDADGCVYIADTGNGRIVKWRPDGTPDSEWGDPDQSAGSFPNIQAVAVDASRFLYAALIAPVANSDGHHIVKFSPYGHPTTTSWGVLGDPDVAMGYDMYRVRGVAVDQNGFVYVVDSWRHRILKFTSNGDPVTWWGGFGDGEGEFNCPWGIAVDGCGHVYVADTNNHRVEMFTSTGEFITQWGVRGTEERHFNFPMGVAADESGSTIYVADSLNHRVQVFSFSPIVAAQEVIDILEAASIADGLRSSLEAKLQAALAALDDPNPGSEDRAVNRLCALLNAIGAQAGKGIPQETADSLTAAVQQLMASIAL